jgi:hypothetical protein
MTGFYLLTVNFIIMKHKLNVFAITAVLATSVLFSSCIGSFKLTNKVLDLNRTVDNKFVKELIFVVLHIIPVYEVAFFFDAVVINAVEFWTDENPISGTRTKQIKENNDLYTIETTENGHKICKENTGETVFLHFDKHKKTWTVEANGSSTTLLKVINEKEVAMYLPNDVKMIVPLNEAGIVAFKNVTDHQFPHTFALQ